MCDDAFAPGSVLLHAAQDRRARGAEARKRAEFAWEPCLQTFQASSAMSSTKTISAIMLFQSQELFAQAPETICCLWVNRVRHHTECHRSKLVVCNLLGH